MTDKSEEQDPVAEALDYLIDGATKFLLAGVLKLHEIVVESLK